MGTNLRSPEAIFTFRFLGRHEDFFVFRAPTWNTSNRNNLDAQQFEGEVAGWCMDNANAEFHVGSFPNVSGYQPMPFASEKGNSLCVYLKAEDVTAFEKTFEIIPKFNSHGML